jgi:hypothetical protein
LTAIAETCAQLTELDLWIVSVPFAAFAQGCPQLRSVILTRVNDADLIAIVRGCPLLECIDLRTASRITDASPLVVAECCPRLRELNLAHREVVTDASFTVLARRCPNLRSIKVVTKSFSDVSLLALAWHCHDLEFISLPRAAVTTAGIVALAKGCPNLRSVELEGCRRVGDDAFYALVDHCESLAYVGTRGTGASSALPAIHGIDRKWIRAHRWRRPERLIITTHGMPDLLDRSGAYLHDPVLHAATRA